MEASQEPAPESFAPVATAEPGQGHRISLRRRNESSHCCDLGPTAKEVLAAFDRVLAEGRSEAILLWPQPIEGIAVFHALASLARIVTCDRQGLATLFFPWNRNSGGTQRTMLVDRDQLVQATLVPLNRVYLQGARHSAFGYLMALHSLKHLSTGEQGNRRHKALQRDPSLMHPTLLEVIPQAGVQAATVRDYDNHFLRRLRRHTWINERGEHISAANDSSQTPFFLFGAHPDSVLTELFRKAGLDPDRGGRRPDIVLIDLTHRSRNALGGNWRDAISKFCGTVEELYGAKCPPALAVTDDVFVLQTLRWRVLNDFDARRGVTTSPKHPARSRLIFNARTDVLALASAAPGSLDELFAEVYSADLLNFVDCGLKLKRSLLEAGDHEIASSVTAALVALQNLIGLPGPPHQFLAFLADNYQGYELQSFGSRFDHLTPRGKINSVIKLGTAGANHAQLVAFLDAYDKLCLVAATQNPGTRLFDACLSRLARPSSRSIISFSSDLIRAFAEWRIENESALADIRLKLGRELTLVDNKEATEELERAQSVQAPYQQILFVEPYADHFLQILTHPALPPKAIVLCHLARAKQILQRAEAYLQLNGVAPVEWNLLIVQESFQKALTGHTIDIPDLDTILLPPRIGTVDLTGPYTPGAGSTRIIRTSGDVQIRAFDGSELAVYDPDALQPFSRRLAKDLQPGDQICVFSPEFVDAAREKLHLSATAPEVLALYHKTVAEAAARLPGQDMTAKAAALRNLIMKIDSSLSLPGPQSIHHWIDVAHLAETPRDEVRPQAPRDRRHYLCFMKALGIADDVTRHYWDWGIFWTRSMRIRSGTAFHQVFMGVLIDPDGAVSRLPEAHRQEVWRIYETAEQHLVAVISNDPEGNADESH
jgi:hypothetical protein